MNYIEEMRANLHAEYENAREEFESLKALHHEVCWYAFELACKDWEEPWPATDPDSEIVLLGRRRRIQPSITLHGYRRTEIPRLSTTSARANNTHVFYSFPTYYQGKVRDAPPLPPRVVAAELTEARRYMHELKRHIAALDEYAPGGCAYNMLCQTTPVGRATSSCCDGTGP